MNDKNWEDTGLLLKLSYEHKPLVEKFLRQIDLDLAKDGGSMVAPVVRRIVGSVLGWDKEDGGFMIKRNVRSNEEAERMLGFIDVDRVTREVALLSLSGFIVRAEMHFYHGSMDMEAEFARLYADSYVSGLVKRYKEEKDRELKPE